ncbi:MAG: FtsX-like permease family protein, partial [Nitrososphaerota archaeon]
MRLDEPANTDREMPVLPALPASADWRARRAGALSAVRLALVRMARSRWLLVVVALGILVADILICTVPLYNTLVSYLQLQNAMTRSDSLQRNMQIDVNTSSVNRPLSDQIAREVQGQADRYLTSFSAPRPMTYISSGALDLNQAGSHRFGVKGSYAEAHLQAFDYAALRPYLRIVEGAFPHTVAANQPLQIMITHEMANDWHLTLGQKVIMSAVGVSQGQVVLTGTITGIFEPVNADDPFWNGLTFSNPSAVTYTLDDDVPAVYPLLTTTDSIFSALSAFADLGESSFGSIGVTQTWVYYANPNRITTDNMAKVAHDILSFRSHLRANLESNPNIGGFRKGSVLMEGGLDQTIESVRQQLSLVTLPLYIIAAQIVGLALFFVAAMASLLIEQQSREIATLKSRGTSSAQLLGIYITQSAFLGVFAAIVGPFLAAALALLVIHWFLPGATSQGGSNSAYLARIAAPALVILPALIGAVLGMAVVILSALQAARLDVLAFRREMARASRQPFWQRAHLDIGLALLCLVGYAELGQFGGTRTRLALGTQANSPFMLLTPAFLLLAGALLLLRLVPLAASLGVRLASRGRGLTSLLAFSQIERTPSRYARMTLLLVLAVGLGLFALTFDASLTRNVHDRTAYAAGADVRLTVNPQISMTQTGSYLDHLKTLPGATDATPLYRTGGRTSSNQENSSVEMLGIDSLTFAGIANPVSWRADYAEQSLPDLMNQLKAHRASSQATVSSHPLWALVSDALAQQLRLHVGDRFQLDLNDTNLSATAFVVGAIVHEFPTLYPQRAPGGFIVVDLRDLEYTIAANSDTGAGSLIGPNEFWLRTTSATRPPHALLQALDRERPALSINAIDSYAEELQQAEANPVNGGMRGLLL